MTFQGVLNRKYKKINSKVRFVGVRLFPKVYLRSRCYALCSLGYGLLSSAEIEAAKKSIRKLIGKNKKIRILTRVYPYLPLTGKPSEVRMGRGKGSRIRKWVSFVRPGKVLFEIRNTSLKRSRLCFLKASEKLSVRTKVLSISNLISSRYF